jgi:recombination protein RecA
MSKSQDMLKQITQSGKLTANILSDDTSPCIVKEWLSTGCITLDAIMGGGLPVGRVTEIYGEYSSGKSLIAAQVAGIAQKQGITVGYVDTETAVSKEMMTMLGVDINDLIYTSPDTVEEVFEFFEATVRAKEKVDPTSILLLIWDSIAATSVKQEMDNEFGKAFYGRHAAIISQGFRKFCRTIAEKRVCLLVLNQTRQKIGVMYGDDVATFGGKAVSFHASVRIELELSSKLKIKKDNGKFKVLGMNTRAVVTKNKVAMPFKEAILPIYFGSGIDEDLSAFMYLKDNDLLVLKGKTYTLDMGDGTELVTTKQEWSSKFSDQYDKVCNIIMNFDTTDYGAADEPQES